MPSARDVRDFLDECVARGWKVDGARRHWRLIPPSGKGAVFMSRTPSDHRWRQNAAALIRRFEKAEGATP